MTAPMRQPRVRRRLPAHVATSAACETCHSKTNFTAWGPGTKMNHTGITSGCAACHTGSGTSPKGMATYAKHVPTTKACETCHTPTNYVAWGPGTPMNHAGITSSCATCHNDTLAKGKSVFPAHIATTQSCEYCHSATNFTAWGPGTKMNHAGITTGCATCQTARARRPRARRRIAAHVVTTQACEYCHTPTKYTAWGPGTKMNHTGITTGCATCHDGTKTPAKGKSSFATHVVTSAGLRILPHAHELHGVGAGHEDEAYRHHDRLRDLPRRCASRRPRAVHPSPSMFRSRPCEPSVRVLPYADELYGVGAWNADEPHRHQFGLRRPATTARIHPPLVGRRGTAPNRARIARHLAAISGAAALPRRPAGSSTTFRHRLCHGARGGGQEAAPPLPGTKPDHSALSANCFSCHNGAVAKGKPVTHLPVNSQCDNCHTTIAFKPARFDHTQTTATCADLPYRCARDGQARQAYRHRCALLRHATSPSTWKTAAAGRFNHATTTAACATCHNGSSAIGKPRTHMITARACETRATRPRPGSRARSSMRRPAIPGEHGTRVAVLQLSRQP